MTPCISKDGGLACCLISWIVTRAKMPPYLGWLEFWSELVYLFLCFLLPKACMELVFLLPAL